MRNLESKPRFFLRYATIIVTIAIVCLALYALHMLFTSVTFCPPAATVCIWEAA